jgi:hypothetical protein
MKDEKYKERLDVSEIDPIILFMILYNNSKQQGMGFLQISGVQDIDQDQAAQILKQQPPCPVHFRKKTNGFQPRMLDYVNGRVMKCSINGEELDTWGYDRDNGEGAAQKSIDEAMEVQDGV